VQMCSRSADMQMCSRSTDLQMYRCADVQMCWWFRGAEEQRSRGAEVERLRDAEVLRC
jgi:hypothetical protein